LFSYPSVTPAGHVEPHYEDIDHNGLAAEFERDFPAPTVVKMVRR
jgi:hypothetical protein